MINIRKIVAQPGRLFYPKFHMRKDLSSQEAQTEIAQMLYLIQRHRDNFVGIFNKVYATKSYILKLIYLLLALLKAPVYFWRLVMVNELVYSKINEQYLKDLYEQHSLYSKA